MATRRVAHPRIVLVIAAVAAMTGCLYGPPYDQLLTGDEELLELARERFTDAGDRVAMAVIDGDEVRTAFVSADSSSMFLLGTGTRLVTGLLLADAIERDEVALDDPVGRHLPLGDAPAASVTLRSLATQHSGLPLAGPRGARATGGDPAAPSEELDELLDRVAVMPVGGPRFAFNDVQAALVGHAVAEAADRDFAELLRERVLQPVGMDDAVLTRSTDDLPDALVPGRSSHGYRVQPRDAGAFAPAVGLVVTIDDLIALASGLIWGDISDSAALDPIAATWWENEGIGYFWQVEAHPERDLISVSGWSDGFCVSILVDPENERAATLLRNTGDTYPGDEAWELFEIVDE